MKSLFLTVLLFAQFSFSLEQNHDDEQYPIFRSLVVAIVVIGGMMKFHDPEEISLLRAGVNCDENPSCLHDHAHCDYLQCVKDAFCKSANDRCYPFNLQGKKWHVLRSCNITQQQREQINRCSQYPPYKSEKFNKYKNNKR